jgi:hypothetical protein
MVDDPMGWMDESEQAIIFVAAIASVVLEKIRSPEDLEWKKWVEAKRSKANAKGQWPTRTHVRGVVIPRELRHQLSRHFCAHLNFHYFHNIIQTKSKPKPWTRPLAPHLLP